MKKLSAPRKRRSIRLGKKKVSAATKQKISRAVKKAKRKHIVAKPLLKSRTTGKIRRKIML